MAANIVATQATLLSSLFPRAAILGGSGDADETGGRRPMQLGQSGGTDTLTELLKVVGLEFVQELIKLCQINYLQIFEPNVLLTGISHFFDNIITQRIQSKARHILNVRLDLQKAPLQKSSLDMLNSGQPKTAFQVRFSVCMLPTATHRCGPYFVVFV